MKLAIIIPAYNEEKSIKDVLLSLPKKIKEVDQIISVVVDDGSKDNTHLISKAHASYAIKHIINLGVGAATTTGIEAAKQLNADMAVTIDADGQHNPKDIEKIIQPILKGRADVVIGTRMLNTKGMPTLKIFGNWTMNIMTLIIFHRWSTDSQSGMKAFNRKAIEKMKFNSIGYEICSEIIGETKRNHLKLREIPIEVIYSDYSKMKGQSFINAVNIFTRSITIKISGKK